MPIVEVEETNEKYYFCGYQARLEGEQSCTIDESSEIVGRITDAGATPEPADVSTIFEVSPDFVWLAAGRAASSLTSYILHCVRFVVVGKPL
jgi:hypothetical protein